MTWNVWWRFGDRWRDRQPRLLAALTSLAPDVVALQEVWATDGRSQADALGHELGLHACFAAPSLPPVPDPPETPDQAGVELGVALLSRWPIAEVEVSPLPARHRDLEPVVLHATLEHPAGPLHVLTCATEWEPGHADDHRAQVERLAALLADPELAGPLPVVLAADLNASPDAEVMRPLLAVAADTWPLGGGDPAGRTLRSEHPWAPLGSTAQLDRRIDHVLVRASPERRVAVQRAFTLPDPIDGLHASDHDPVVVDLELSPGP